MFTTPLEVREIGYRDERVIWELLSPLVYNDITVPAGFQTDLCSVPRHPAFVFGLVGAKLNRTGVLHDYACRKDSIPVFTFEQANRLFWESAQDCWPDETNDFERNIMYDALMAFAKPHYHRWTVDHRIIP